MREWDAPSIEFANGVATASDFLPHENFAAPNIQQGYIKTIMRCGSSFGGDGNQDCKVATPSRIPSMGAPFADPSNPQIEYPVSHPRTGRPFSGWGDSVNGAEHQQWVASLQDVRLAVLVYAYAYA
jgi:hypothetical protein